MHDESRRLNVVTHDADIASIGHDIDSFNRELEILDAGCGRKWPLKLTIPYRLTGIDTDTKAIALRQQTRGDLSTVIVSDLGNATIADSSFDVIYCSYVLEHISDADRVLVNFVRWLKPGGLMIIRVPDRDSVYGWITRHSPFWLHVLHKRWIVGNVNAGKPGFDPYPVYYNKTISRAGMISFCQEHDLILCDVRGVGTYLRKSPLVRLVAMTGFALSLGRLAWRHNNLTFTIRVPANS
jgi:SAM-dependent methyltransferase